MFDNISLLAPDDHLLARISRDRAEWYLERELAEKLGEDTVRLLFEPKGRKVYSKYEVEPKEHKCVVCGTDQELTRHHVVPYRFRKYLPEEYKNRSIFDILPVCRPCHNDYHSAADVFIIGIFKQFNVVDRRKEIKSIRNCVSTLSRHYDKIPEDRKTSLIARVEEHTGNPLDMDKLHELMEELLVEESLCLPDLDLIGMYEVTAFIRMWRRHFVDTMEPKHLSQTWLEEMDKVFPRE